MSLLNLGIKAFQYAPRAMAGVRSLLSDPVKSTGLVTGGILGGKATEETINSGILGNSNMIQEGMNFFSSPAINFLNDIRNTPSGSIVTPDQGAIDAENKFNEELNKKITTATQDNQSNILITPEVEQPSGLLTTPEIDPLDFSNTTPMPDQSLLSDYILTAEEAPETEEGLLSESSNPYYSVLAEAVLDMNFNSGSGQQILNQINNMPGIKQSEIVDTGLDNFLSSKDKVTKEELDNYILENNISTKITDTFLDDRGVLVGGKMDITPDYLRDAPTMEKAIQLVQDRGELYDDFIRLGEQGLFGSAGEGVSFNDFISESDMETEKQLIQEYLETRHNLRQVSGVNTKYQDYTLEGGENYKEMLITVPSEGRSYIPPHFTDKIPDGENLIAHARFNEREINGKKTLFIEEIQSDLHQKGRKEGYTDNTLSAEIKELEDRQFAKELEMRDIIADLNNLAINRKNMDADEYSAQYQKIENLRKELNKEIVSLGFQAQKLTTEKNKKVPNAPFKKNWHELTMKRLIKYAIDNGFEAISFTPGEIQNERYDLSEQIDNVSVAPSEKSPNKIYIQAYSKGNLSQILGHHILPEQLDDYVGKDLADKIRTDINNNKSFQENRDINKLVEEGVVPTGESNLIYKGLDLKVGGEGMVGFYDKMLPSFINKFSKKYGAKLEEGSFGNKKDGAVSFDSGATFDYKDTKLKNAQTIDDVYSIAKKDDYLMSEFKLYLRDDLNELDPDSLVENLSNEELESYMNEWLINDYGMEIGTSNFTTVPILEFTPKMIEEIGKKGITLAKLNSGLLSVA